MVTAGGGTMPFEDDGRAARRALLTPAAPAWEQERCGKRERGLGGGGLDNNKELKD